MLGRLTLSEALGQWNKLLVLPHSPLRPPAFQGPVARSGRVPSFPKLRPSPVAFSTTAADMEKQMLSALLNLRKQRAFKT